MQKLLNLGRLNVLLRCSNDRFWQFADRRYGDFVHCGRKSPDETVEVDVVANPGVPDHLAGTTPVRFLDDDVVEVIRGNGIGKWKRASRYCRIRQAESDYLPDLEYPDYVADSIIRIILSVRLLDDQGCLIHSAGLVRDGKGYLFVGKSGVGKSTISCMSAHKATVLSDDCTLLRLDHGGAHIYSTPFFSTVKGSVNLSAPLHGIYFLRQATENKLTPLPANSAMRQLLQSVMFVGQDRASSEKILAVAQAICKMTSCFTLDFVRNDSFWELIHA